MRSYCARASCDFLYWHLAPGRALPYRGCAEIVRKSCNTGAVAMQTPRENRRTLVRAPDMSRGDGAVAVSKEPTITTYAR